MTKKDYTHLTLVVDRSGSMATIKEEAQKGISDLLREQFLLPGKLTLTLVDFDDVAETVVRLSGKAIDYNLEPRNTTALFDAVGQEIIATGKDLANMEEDERPEKVVFIVVTDGENNSSREYTLESVRDLIANQKENYQWAFQFLGAEEASWQGDALGMRTSSYSSKQGGSEAAYAVVNSALQSYRADANAVDLDLPEILFK